MCRGLDGLGGGFGWWVTGLCGEVLVFVCGRGGGGRVVVCRCGCVVVAGLGWFLVGWTGVAEVVD